MEQDALSELIVRARAGDHEAWATLVQQYSGLLWGVARTFRMSEAQRADAVQTTWLRLVEHLGDIRDPQRLAGWLATTARRTCLESFRRPIREEALSPTTDGNPDPAEKDHESEAHPEVHVLRDEHRALVRRALDSLPDRQRVLIEMLVSAPTPNYREVSRQLGMPVGSIGPTRARILERMRVTLAASGLEDMALT